MDWGAVFELVRANWATVAQVLALLLGGIGSVGGFVMFLVKRRLDRVSARSSKAGETATSALEAAQTGQAEAQGAKAVAEAMAVQFQTLADALDYANERITRQEKTLRLLTANHGRLTKQFTQMRAELEEVWAYAMAWEAAVAPEDDAVRTRITVRVGRARPARGMAREGAANGKA